MKRYPRNSQTVLNVYQIYRKTILPLFKEFSNETPYRYLYSNSTHFDALIGIYILQQLEAIVNIQQRSLQTKTFNIDIKLIDKMVSRFHTIEEESKEITQ